MELIEVFALADYECVIAFAEEAHFGCAARRLGVTQPALSSRLRRIETALQVRLFDRDRGGVRLTAAGVEFVDGSARVILAAREAEQGARAAGAGKGQLLRIGMTHIAAYQLMAPILTAFVET